MQIDKYITELVKLRQTYGPNLEVVRRKDGILSTTTTKALLPRLANMRSDQPRVLFNTDNDLDKNKGERVVLL